MGANKKQQKSLKRDLLRYDDINSMRDLATKMNKHRVEDKNAFKNNNRSDIINDKSGELGVQDSLKR